MGVVTWAVECDVDGDGSFEVSLGAYLANQDIEIARGVSREGSPQSVQVAIVLDNSEGYLNTRYLGAGEPAETLRRIRTGTPLRVTATLDETGYTRFSGWVRKVVTKRATAELVCEGLIGWFGTAPNIFLTASEARTSMTALGALMVAAGRSADDLDLPAEGGEAFPWHFSSGENPAQALTEAAMSEMAGNNLYEVGDGRLRAETNRERLGMRQFDRLAWRYGAGSLGAQWRMEEYSGVTAFDYGPNGNHCTLVNGPTRGVSIGGAFAGQGADAGTDFEASSSQYGTVAHDASLNVGDTFTAYAIVIVESAHDGVLMTKGPGWMQLAILNGETIHVARAGFGDVVFCPDVMLPGEERFIAVTKDGADVHVYLDGEDVTGSVTNQTMANNTNALEIGRNWGGLEFGGLYFDGVIVRKGLMGRALTADEVLSMQLARVGCALDEASDIQVLDGWQVLESDDDVTTSVEARATVFFEGLADDVVWELGENMFTRPPTSIFQAAGTRVRSRFQAGSAVTAFHEPVATLDYAASENQDGSGADRTASVEFLVTDLGGGWFDLERVTTTDDVYWAYGYVRAEATLEMDEFTTQAYAAVAKSVPAHPTGSTRSIDIPWGSLNDTVFAFAVQELHAGRMGLERFEAPVGTMTDAEQRFALEREIGDLLWFDDEFAGPMRGAYLRDWFYVEGIYDRVSVESGHLAWECRLRLAASYAWRDVHCVAKDDFARDDAVGGLGTALTGQAWADDSGFDLDGGVAIANGDGAATPSVDLGELAFDQVVEVSIAELSGSDALAGLNYRKIDDDNHYRLYVDLAAEEAVLSKVVATVETVIATVDWTAGAQVELRAMCQGKRHRAWVDNVLVIDEEDATQNTGTGAGLFGEDADGEAAWVDFYGQRI
jgi:hypothetical protein